MATPKEEANLKSTIDLMAELNHSFQREFSYVWNSKTLIANSIPSNYPPNEIDAIKKDSSSLIEGALLIYLFALWEALVPRAVSNLMEQGELERFSAYRHVRNSAAHHKHRSGRTNHPECRKAFDKLNKPSPFCGIQLNAVGDKMDLSNSNVAMDCHQFMTRLAQELVARYATRIQK